jgi:HK97 family phage portal protein
MAQALLYGNAYAEIEFDNRGLPTALWPLPAWRVTPLRTQEKELFYRVTLPDGSPQNLPPYQVWRLSGLITDGDSGLSVIQQAREPIGLAIATEKFGATYFSQGANVGGVVEHPSHMTGPASDRLYSRLNDKYAGLGSANRLMLLEEGMHYQKVGIPPNDSQFIESRQFQIEDIARMFRVPLHMIGHLLRSTNNNIEHQGIEFVVYTMNPWYVNCEQETNFKLFGLDSGYFNEFIVDGLLRGDSAARSAYYQARFNMGSISPNDIREKENENPVEGGDDCYVQLNMVPLKDAGLGLSSGANALGIPEIRAKKGAAVHRRRVAQSYRSVFEAAAAQVVKTEVSAVRRAARKYFSERSIDQWQIWLEDFYRDFPAHVIKAKMGAAFMSLADAIKFIAANEVNIKEPSVDNFVKAYNENFGAIYSDSSKGQLEAIVRDAGLKNTDPLIDIEGRLDEWELKRPGKVALNETVRLANAVAKTVFVAAGITKLVWASLGSKSCDFCESIDGQVVGIESKFSTSGLSAAGHPPIHEGCECQIVPE